MMEEVKKLEQEGKKVLILGKKEHLDKYIADNKWNMGNDLNEIAKNIFMLLRKVDKEDFDFVIIEGVESKGLGLAITNRLIRACAYNYIIV